MTFSLRKLMAGLVSASVLLLVACGGGGGGDDDDNTPAVTPPNAVAKADKTSVPINTVVTLDGSGSSTPNGGTLSYQWEISKKPDDSSAALSSSTSVQPSFTPDVAGNYEVALTVKDSVASSAAALVQITATTTVPTAVINPESQSLLRGLTATLDASASLPPTGVDANQLNYQWTLTAKPEGDTTTTLQDATSAKASFLANTIGAYKAKVVVSYGDKSSSAEATINVNNGNSSPVSKPNVPATAVRGQTVTLDGSGSSDPDGNVLHYRWSFPFITGKKSRPTGSNATIDNPTSAKASFVPDAVGTYRVQLTVYDDSVATSEVVIVEVTKPEGDANTPPVAVMNGNNGVLECEQGARSCSPNAYSAYDNDGDKLYYKWSWTDAAGVKQTNTDDNFVQLGTLGGDNSLVGTPDKSYPVQLIVNDGKVDSAPATLTIKVKTGANTAPVAKIAVGTPKVMKGETITFDGSGSSDKNGDEFFYHWTLTDRPDNSKAELQNTTSEKATVVTDQPGIYTASLTVTDSKGAASGETIYTSASVFAKAHNNAPVISNLKLNGNNSPEVFSGQPVVLHPGDTRTLIELTADITDPDNDAPIDYIWQVVKQPNGSNIKDFSGTSGPYEGKQVINSWSNEITALGDYEFKLLLSDGIDLGQPQSVSFSVVNLADYPSLYIEETKWFTQQQFFGSTMLFGGTTSYDQIQNPTNQSNQYTLTAFDRDYTITNLTATSVVSGYTPSFVGITNGQVIKKGTSVTFTMTRPNIADEAQLAHKLEEISLSDDSDNRANTVAEMNRQEKIIGEYQFEWRFEVKERPDFIFTGRTGNY